MTIGTLREEAFKAHLPVMREETSELLAKIVKEKHPKEILEVGTCIGVSGLTVLSAGNGRLTTIEKDEDLFLRAKENFEKFGFKDRVKQICGLCEEVLEYMRGNRYDLIILDGPKSGLSAQYEIALEMLDKGGIIFIDDINYHGMIQAEGAPHKQRTIILAMRAFLEKIKNDERAVATFYDMEDGVAVVEKR